MASEIVISPVSGKADTRAFVDLVYRLYANDPAFVPPLRSEALEMITPGKNPFFEHARHQFFLARRSGEVVGRISAHIDELALAQPTEQGMGPGTGNWGLMEAEDEATAAALIARAEQWLRQQGMTRVLAPMSLSVWEEPGLLIKGFDHPPMVMMGHHSPKYQGWIEAKGYAAAKTLYTYDLDVTKAFPPLIQRIVASGEKNPRIRVRSMDTGKFAAEAAVMLEILNDAWSDNWGFVPITDNEIAYTAKKLRPLVRGDLILIAELDGEPVAFLMTLPDVNQALKRFGGRAGKPSPLGWLRLLKWIWRPRNADMRVPLMGVRKKLQASRLASQLAFIMIDHVRRTGTGKYGAQRGEIGWILDDNRGMNSIAEAIGSSVNKEYRIYDKPL